MIYWFLPQFLVASSPIFSTTSDNLSPKGVRGGRWVVEATNWPKELPGKLESIKPGVSANSNQKQRGQIQTVKYSLQGQGEETKAKGRKKVAWIIGPCLLPVIMAD